MDPWQRLPEYLIKNYIHCNAMAAFETHSLDDM